MFIIPSIRVVVVRLVETSGAIKFQVYGVCVGACQGKGRRCEQPALVLLLFHVKVALIVLIIKMLRICLFIP